MNPCADALSELMALGVTGEALVAAIRRLEQAAYGDRIATLEAAVALASEKADRELEERRSRDRDRKRASRVRGIPVTSTDSADTKDVSPTPPSENNPYLPKGPLKGPQKVSVPSSDKPKPKPIGVWVAEIWEITPRPGRERSGKPKLENAIRAALRRGADPAAIKRGCEGYFASDDATKSQGQFCQGVHTVVGSGRWETFAEDEPASLPTDTDPWPRRLHGWRANQYWNSEWGPKPGKPGYLGPEPQARAA